MTESREHMLGRIQGLMEAEQIAAAKPTSFAFSVRQTIADRLEQLRSDLVEGHHE